MSGPSRKAPWPPASLDVRQKARPNEVACKTYALAPIASPWESRLSGERLSTHGPSDTSAHCMTCALHVTRSRPYGLSGRNWWSARPVTRIRQTRLSYQRSLLDDRKLRSASIHPCVAACAGSSWEARCFLGCKPPVGARGTAACPPLADSRFVELHYATPQGPMDCRTPLRGPDAELA